MARLPLRFEANAGQWGSAVRYAGNAGGYSVLLTASGPTLSFGDNHRVDVVMRGGNPAPVMSPEFRQATQTSYFVGSRDRWSID
jgi:hypothetical protein